MLLLWQSGAWVQYFSTVCWVWTKTTSNYSKNQIKYDHFIISVFKKVTLIDLSHILWQTMHACTCTNISLSLKLFHADRYSWWILNYKTPVVAEPGSCRDSHQGNILFNFRYFWKGLTQKFPPTHFYRSVWALTQHA